MKRVAVIVFPGSNCDAETLAAAHAAGSDAYFVWHRATDLRQADVVILPGGFSYGDYLRSGAIARFSRVMGAVTEHARAGGAVLGICNGFQILCEAGLLPRRDAPALGGQDGARVFHSMEARHATQHAVDVRAVDDRHLRV